MASAKVPTVPLTTTSYTYIYFKYREHERAEVPAVPSTLCIGHTYYFDSHREHVKYKYPVPSTASEQRTHTYLFRTHYTTQIKDYDAV